MDEITPLRYAAENGYDAIVNLLLNHKDIDIEMEDEIIILIESDFIFFTNDFFLMLLKKTY